MSGTTSPRIFVDDADPRIEYTNMALGTLNDANIPQFAITPLYRTLHAPIVLDGTISFDFEGTAISAFFTSNSSTRAIRSCLVDNVQQSVLLDDQGANVVCQTDKPLPSGKHMLLVDVSTVFLDGDLVLFDYLEYTPSGSDISGEDVVYYAGDPSIKLSASDQVLSPGGTLEFDFFGRSLGIYADFSNDDSHSPSGVSYAIDDQTPLKISINNSASSANPDLAGELILQTPVFSSGQHHLHVVFLGTSETVPFELNRIIVQNSNPQRDLDPFPPISSLSQGEPDSASSIIQKSSLSLSTSTTTASSSPFSNQPSISTSQGPHSRGTSRLGIALGTSAGVICLLLFFGVLVCCRRRRSRPAELSDGRDLFVRPYLFPRNFQVEVGTWRSLLSQSGNDRFGSKRSFNATVPNDHAQAVPVASYHNNPAEANPGPRGISELPPAYSPSPQIPARFKFPTPHRR